MRDSARRFGIPQAAGLAALLFLTALLFVLGYRLTPPGGAASGGSSLKLLRRRIPQRANLVLITIDGLRLDRVGVYGAAGPSPTPKIDSLARQGFRFEQAVTPFPASLPAHAALMTGLGPAAAGIVRPLLGALPESRTTLAETLRDAGLRTAAFLGSGALGPWSGLAQGFETYDAPQGEGLPATSRALAGREASEVVDAARAWVDDHFRHRFFLWAQLSDPLSHQAAPEGERRRRYDAAVAEADAGLGRLLDRLASLGVMDQTIVAVAASHGLGLGDHGEGGSGAHLYDTTVRVPLLLRLPDSRVRDRSIPEQVRLVDLAPTLLDLLRIEDDAPRAGESLVPLLDPQGALPPLPAVSETTFQEVFLGGPRLVSLRFRGWKYVDGPAPLLFNLRDDPGETEDLSAESRSRVERMRAELLRAAGPAATPGGGAAPGRRAIELIEEGIAALRAGRSARARGALSRLVGLLDDGGAGSARDGRGALPPGPPPALLALLGASLQLEGRPEEALPVYERALAALGDGGAGGVLEGRASLEAVLRAEISVCSGAATGLTRFLGL